MELIETRELVCDNCKEIVGHIYIDPFPYLGVSEERKREGRAAIESMKK
jgi:hypothetical protein